jgi:hypothetical protein
MISSLKFLLLHKINDVASVDVVHIIGNDELESENTYLQAFFQPQAVGL